MGWKISDKPTVDPKDTDLVLLEQDGNTRNTTWAKLKAFFLGTATLATTDQTIKGAINEVKASTDANTTSLSEKANDTDTNRTTTDKTVTGSINELNSGKAPKANPTFAGVVKTANNTLDDGNGGASIKNGLELYSLTAPSSPYIDFHSSGSDIDYDVRIIATGGSSTVGQGTLNLIGSSIYKNGHELIETLNNGYKKQSGQANITVSTAGTEVTTTITFPNAFSVRCTEVLVSVMDYSVGTIGYININAKNFTTTGFTIRANSYVAQILGVQWVAFGE